MTTVVYLSQLTVCAWKINFTQPSNISEYEFIPGRPLSCCSLVIKSKKKADIMETIHSNVSDFCKHFLV